MKRLTRLKFINFLCITTSLIFLFTSCNKTENNSSNTLFNLIDNEQTNIHFANVVKEDLYFNFLNYSYIYNGSGVAVGDINNDGLQDLYFTSNQGSNKLYLNKGDFEFQDITAKANVTDDKGWTTGVTMVDINNDGWLDMYVCKSGSLNSHDFRKNKLYINQKNNTFKESASSYRLDHYGFSTQAYFFDYDNDSDLDMYLVNHRQDFQNNVSIDTLIQQNKEPYNSDQLFRNEGSYFTNVTVESGILNKAWGLSASIGDFNDDTLLDIYVANDFLEPDFLYINQGNGTFEDEILERFKHISANSMGSDYADINNDLKPDLIVLDMLAEDHIRGKENMATMSIDNFNSLVNIGYHHQYMSNMLQINNGDGTFSEIGQLAGVAKTDWSWAPLIADFDNDGYNDLFVTNGIENDLSNQDFRNQMKRNIQARKKVSLDEAINMMPSSKLGNYIFKNNKDLTFDNATEEWGLNTKVNSNGAVYADLDNDGDLDIIVNNQAEEAHIYQNNSSNNFIIFSFVGSEKNKKGIGSKIKIYTKGLQQSKELFTSRGYQSSVTNKLHFGLGTASKIDSVEVIWPNGASQLLTNIEVNKTISLHFKDSKNVVQSENNQVSFFEAIEPSSIGINYLQQENLFNDFNLQLLLPQKQSEMSSPLAIADVNNDGLDDFFAGNSKDAPASFYIQKNDGLFVETNQSLFESDKAFEDTDAEFIDVDNDKDLDLYVTSGGYEIEENSPLLQDRLYLNDGKGKFKKAKLPKMLTNTKGITFTDYDNDGDNDIFVGSRVIHGKYPLANTPFLLENRDGLFVDVTSEKFDGLSEVQMINDAVFSDYDNDGDDDLIIVGEWMPVVIFENDNKQFIKKEIDEIKGVNGWCQTITASDLDKDGNIDYIIGNWGSNNKFHPTIEKPLHIYADNFDDNSSFDMALSKVSKTGDLLPVRGKECSSQQTPYLNAKLKTYKEFANSSMEEIYGSDKLAKATHFKVNNLQSVILKNKGNGHFERQELVNYAQFGPTLGLEIHDVDQDGYMDIIGVGNVFDAEVETIRYDASKGYTLLGSKDGGYQYSADYSYFNNKEAKTIKKIIINDEVHFIILNKNSKLKILKLKTPKGFI